MKHLAATAFALFAMPLSAQEASSDQHMFGEPQCLYEDKWYGTGAIVILEDGTKIACRLRNDIVQGYIYTWVPEMKFPRDKPFRGLYD